VDPEPIAAASIAQVHRARLADGREVAVKVRYPDVAGLVEEDLAALESIFDVVGRLEPDVQLRPISDYLRWSLPLELDLSREARAMKELRDALADREDVAIPRPVDGLATEGLLVMDYFEGIRVNDRAALVGAGIDLSEVATLLNDAFADQLFRRGILHADPHPGNVLVQPGPRLVLLDHGLTLRLDEPFVGTLAGVVSALGGGDLEAVGGALRDAGLPVEEGADLETLLQLVGVVLGGGDAGAAAGGEAEDEADAADLGGLTGRIGAAVRDLPPRLLLVGRAIALLDGVTRQLDEGLDALEIVSRYADGSDDGGGSSPT
jgi:predicted unusual protein kinase regulating ubiquinone biosynthesis (AarF/ABC1/UbiB family)